MENGPDQRPTYLVRREREKYILAIEIVNELLQHSTIYKNIDNGGENPCTGAENDNRDGIPSMHELDNDEEKPQATEMKETTKKETALLVAAKNGVTEIVERILDKFPIAIHDTDADGKNILLVAAENRQLYVYKLLKKRKIPKNLVMRKEDKEWNNVLHMAATRETDYYPWPVPGAALQMLWEIKWYKFVAKSLPQDFFVLPNKNGETPERVFSKKHEDLVKAGSEWIKTTSTAYSVVATLIATVVFVSCTTFPGGTDEHSGKPKLESKKTLDTFMNSSLIALSFSVTSLMTFLGLLTSRYQEKDFGTNLPRKLFVGLTSLFLSIMSMLTSFCSGYFFVLEHELKHIALLVYVVMLLPLSLFAVVQFPLYRDFVKATFWSPF